MSKNSNLPKTVKIKRSNGSKLTLSRHVELHRRQYAIVAEGNAEKLLLTAEMLAAWKANIELEEDLNKRSQISVHTAEMLKMDQQRDELLSTLFGVVRAYLHSHVDQMKSAAVEMDRVLHPYYGIQKGAYDVETADIVGLLKDLEPLTNEVMTLGMTGVVAELKTVNEAYERLMKQRGADDVDAKLPASNKVRPETDEQFAVICQHIEAAYIVAKTDVERKMIFDLVALMNSATDETLASHNQGQAQKKSAEGKRLEKMLRTFETENGWAPNALSFTGKTAKDESGTKLYEVKSTGELFWVKIDKGKLVKGEKVKE